MKPLQIALAAALLFAGASAARADNFDAYCNLPGFKSSLRQTIIVLDEHNVFAESNGQHEPRNDPWRHFIGNFLLTQVQGALEQNFAPREHITLLLARKDGSGLKAVFSGCIPFYSAAEKDRIERDAGAMRSIHSFFGTGPVATAAKDMDVFRIRLGDAVRAALDPAELSPGQPGQRDYDLVQSGLVTSLKQTGFVALGDGLPRIVIFSDMNRFFGWLPPDSAKARQAGLDRAHAAGVNFRDAEIYLVGISRNDNSAIRDALEMFFLGSHGELAGAVPASSLPNFSAAPFNLVRYQGLIQYPDNKFPIRIRLATDQNGTVVDSWFTIQASSEQYSPFHGVITCQDDGACTYSGDDVFAQVWNLNRSQGRDPVFDQSLPFAGARSLNFRSAGDSLKGNISDPVVRFEGVAGAKLEFSAVRQAKGLF
jgi:hypothetical protein